jgi:formylglycine-generating enzyme required for sulfatase activity
MNSLKITQGKNAMRLPTIFLTVFFIGCSDYEQAEHPKEFTNSIGMKFVLIPAGKFTMGSPLNESDRSETETQHEVTISKSYYLGAYEVTKDQYIQVSQANAPSTENKASADSKKDKIPVDRISWNDAVEFCKKLSEMPEEKAAGRVYRLPTEAEWEYACRAGTKTAYCSGNDEEGLKDYAWTGDSRFDQARKAHPVGKKKPNAWGLYDMHGNVWEWCNDWWGRHGLYGPNPSVAVVDPQGPREGTYRLVRGGSIGTSAKNCRSAYRFNFDPSSDALIACGFRVVLIPAQ